MRGRGEGSLFPYRGAWRALVTDNGRRRAFTIHAASRSEAEAQLRDLLQQRDGHTLPVDQTTTLADWALWWVEHAALKPRVRDNYRSTLQHHVAHTWLGKIRLSQLTPEHLENYYTEALAGKHSTQVIHEPVDDPHPDPRRKHPKTKTRRVPLPLQPTTVRGIHAVIRSALTEAVRRRRIAFNPASVARPPRVQPHTLDTLTLEETTRVLKAAGASGTAVEARWSLALILALRPGEALALGPEHVHHDHIEIRRQLQQVRGKGTVLVPFTKTGAGRRDVPIPENIARMLRRSITAQRRARLAAGADWVGAHTVDGGQANLVFAQADGRPITSPVDTKQWRTLLEMANVPQKRRYTARHTAATLMFSMGMDAPTVSAILGHRRASFTIDTYVHPLEDEKRRAAETMARRLLG